MKSKIQKSLIQTNIKNILPAAMATNLLNVGSVSTDVSIMML